MKMRQGRNRLKRCLLASALLAAPIGATWIAGSAGPAGAGSLVCYTGPYVNVTLGPQQSASSVVFLGGNIFGGTFNQDTTSGGTWSAYMTFTHVWQGFYGERLIARWDVPSYAGTHVAKGWLLVAYAC
jgi:hypothetical protein